MQIGWGTAAQPVNYDLVSAGWPAASALRNVAYAFFQDCKLNQSFNVQRLVFSMGRTPATPLGGSATVSTGANPAHVLWEVLTNQFAGGRFATGDLDFAAFNAPAETLAGEGVGANVLFDGKSLKDIVSTFIAEFDAVLRIRGGKISPKLLRDDYDADSLPVIDERNSSKVKRRREPFGPGLIRSHWQWTGPWALPLTPTTATCI